MFCRKRMLIIFFLIAVIDLTASMTFDRKKPAKPAKNCKNPKGKSGDTYTVGCIQYTCSSGKWTEEDKCLETEISSSSICRPYCPFYKPFCKGLCIGNGALCAGFCYLFPSDTKNCGVAAAQTASNECNTECNDATDTCQNCLLENIPDFCEDINFKSCLLCTKSVLKAASQCLQNLTLACVKDHLSSTSCYSCICDIVCHVAGPDHALCKACKGSTDNSIAEFWSSAPGLESGTNCPPGWMQSIEKFDSKCYKIAPTQEGSAEVIWEQGQVTCRGIDGVLAVPDNAARHSAVASALSISSDRNCWISGKQEGNSQTFFWYPASGNPFFVNSSDFGTESGCIVDTIPTPSCLYADANGMACNAACQVNKCVVCEMNAF